MVDDKKRLLVSILLIISAIVIYKIPRLFINKNIEPLPEVKLKEINDVKSFAIMIQNENGYEEYNKDTWPTTGYKFKEAKCIDNNGSKVDNAITYNNGKVTLETDKTVYCTLYFDIKNTINALDIVASKPKSLSPKPDQGDMYRYQGTSELVNDNYICFGTDSKEACTNDEDHYMYRIIGITPEGEMKLIKQTPIVEEDNTIFGWYKVTGTDERDYSLFGTAENGVEIWPDSLIYKRLNGISNGTITGDGRNAYYSPNQNINANTNILVDGYTNEYPYMKRTNDWYSKIVDHDWIYGDSTEQIYDGHKMYQIETSQIETKCTTYDFENSFNFNATCKIDLKKDFITAKIGLPYVHDILLSYYNVEENKRGIPENANFNSWINSSISDRPGATMERCISTRGSVYPSEDVSFKIYKSDGIDIACNTRTVLDTHEGASFFPTFYISNTIEMEGTGIETDPYRIVN